MDTGEQPDIYFKGTFKNKFWEERYFGKFSREFGNIDSPG